MLTCLLLWKEINTKEKRAIKNLIHERNDNRSIIFMSLTDSDL